MSVSFPNNQLKEALPVIAHMIGKSEAAQKKFAPGTSQFALLQNRIHALSSAFSLVANELAGYAYSDMLFKAELKTTAEPTASLISKCEKAQQKMAQGAWQYRMLESNIEALQIASSLLEKRLNP